MTPTPTARKPGISARAIILGTLLTPFNAFWIVRLERVMFGPYPSTISLFANVVFVLFLLIGLNALLRRFVPRLAFSQGELLTLYTMLAISTGLAGLDGVGILSQIIPHGAWFGAARGWEKFLPAFPSWLVVSDHEILRGHYLGNSTFYRWEVVRVWITPFLAWTLFMTLLMFVAHCINVLVRRQWADRERLTFPIVWLPLEMTEEGSGAVFFRNRLMWSGFAVAAGLGLWNGIAFLYPSLPSLPLGITDLKPLITAKPWSAIDWFPVTLYPLAIGLGFLLPLDLLFSCWFFFLFWKAQVVLSNAMAWDTTPDFPFIKEQGFGAVLGIFLFICWNARRHGKTLRETLVRTGGRARGALGAEAEPDAVGPSDRTESLMERRALAGVVAGLLGLLIFCHLAGVSGWVALLFFALFLPTLVVVTRIRAELGAPVHDFHFMGPDSMLPRALGAASFHQHDMAFFTFTFTLTRAHRSDTMPVGLEGLQMAHLRHLEARRMFGAILLATFVGTLSAFWAFEHQAYTLGAGAKFNQGFGHAQQAFDRMNSWVSGTLDRRPNAMGVGAIGIGFVTTLLLFALRLRWFGFPFHPLGYAISSSWSIHLVWLPLLMAWALKGLTLRYGGLRAYRRFLPFFLGLILGDCIMGSLWALLSLLLNMRTYNFFGS
jgi:hypothetical protein